MIITVSGAACTGKTTILEHIQESIDKRHIYSDHIFTYGEFIRTMYEDKYSSKYKSFADLLQGDPLDIIKLHKDTARKFNDVLWSSDTNNDILIFDRCPIDINIYLYMNVAQHLDNPIIRYEYRKAASYVSRCIDDFLNHNPKMFYTRPFTQEIEQDGFRPMSLINRRELELSLFDKEFLSRAGVIMLPSDLDDRKVFLDEYFENYL